MRARRSRLPLFLSLFLFAAGFALAVYFPARRAMDKAEVERALKSLESSRPPSTPSSPTPAPQPLAEGPAAAPEAPAPAAAQKTVRVVVRDKATGEVLPEVRYSLRDYRVKDDPEELSAPGEFSVPVPTGMIAGALAVAAEDHEKFSTRLMGDKAEPIELALGPDRVAAGTVVDEAGNPIAGVEVSLSVYCWKQEDNRYSSSFDTTTDAEGRWQVAGVPAQCDEASYLLRHPDYAGDIMYGRTLDLNATPPNDVLKKGRELQGLVVAQDGAPIPDASVQFCREKKLIAQSGADGKFIFPQTSEEYFNQQVLKVSAAGFATTYFGLQPRHATGEVKITMPKGAPLKLRFLSPSGNPLANTTIYASLSRTGYFQQVDSLEYPTAEDGTVTIDDAPTEVKWDFSAASANGETLVAVEDLELKPDGGVQVIRFRKPPAIRVLAKDAMTGEPLKSFMVSVGYPMSFSDQQPWWRKLIDWRPGEKERISWTSRGRKEASGVYVAEVSDFSNRSIYFRLDAEGYYPQQTPLVSRNAGDASIVVSMRRGDSVLVRPLDAEGGPLEEEVRACWMEVDREFWVYNVDNLQSSGVSAARRDDEGWLHLLPVDRQNQLLVVTCEYGVAIRDAALVKSREEVRLMPWATISGTISEGAKRMATDGVVLDQRVQVGQVALRFRQDDSTTTNDTFEMKKVYPAQGILGPQKRLQSEWGRTSEIVPWAVVSPQPGEQVRLDMSGGRAVSARVQVPPGAEDLLSSPNLIYFQRVDLPIDKNYRIGSYLELSATGTASVGALPPGTYKIEGSYLSRRDRTTGEYQESYLVPETDFKVPDDGGTTPVDIGTLTITRTD